MSKIILLLLYWHFIADYIYYVCLKLQELEQIEDTWKTDARHQRDRIDHLEEENHRLNLTIRDKIVDAKLQAGMTAAVSDFIELIRWVKRMVTQCVITY